eukprot:TRINITY_DN2974_c0_g1_i1.p1 TRINITY_DN2974_c0_g1~~TRINITY_DN2974_c0_g1_i1.p1  ORF type:complete len:481 (-),score=57.62 TRINITY_DN2974_c0_g1_i1:167-1483(-)
MLAPSPSLSPHPAVSGEASSPGWATARSPLTTQSLSALSTHNGEASSRVSVVVDGLLAETNNSRVFRAHSVSGQLLVVKEIDVSRNGNLGKREVKANRALPTHPCLVPLIGCVCQETCSLLIMPYLPHPTLNDFLKSNGPLAETAALFIFSQLLDTVGTLRNANFFHRDIKSSNILINTSTLRIYLIDFGLVTRSSYSDKFVGTPLYMSPEVLARSGPYDSFHADLWSCGTVLFEVLLGAQPFKSADTVPKLQHIHNTLHFSEAPYSAHILRVLSTALHPVSFMRPDVYNIQQVEPELATRRFSEDMHTSLLGRLHSLQDEYRRAHSVSAHSAHALQRQIHYTYNELNGLKHQLARRSSFLDVEPLPELSRGSPSSTLSTSPFDLGSGEEADEVEADVALDRALDHMDMDLDLEHDYSMVADELPLHLAYVPRFNNSL